MTPIILEDSEDDYDDFRDLNQQYLLPIHPFRLVIVGESNSGKTYIVKILIKYYLNFDALYVCAKDIHESKYSKLQERYTLFEGVEREELLNL